MFELFKSEYGRYKYWGMGCFIFILATYSFLARLKPFLQPDQVKSLLIPTILFGAAFIFGILQMALHRRKNQWTYLVHRPLSMLKIYLSLSLAGFALLLLVIVLPWLIMVISLDFFGSAVVDNRHYVYGLFLLITSLLIYLIGQLTVTNPSRAIVCLITLPMMLLFPWHSSNAALLLPFITLSLILIYLNIKSFKPDLNTYVKAPAFVFVMSVLMSFGIANLLVTIMSIEAQLPNTLASKINKTDTVSAMRQKSAIEKLRYILKSSTHTQVQQILAQAQLIEPEDLMVGNQGYPGTRIGQLHINDFGYREAKEESNNTTWQFSHDSQLIEGRDSFTGAPIGAIGVRGFIYNLSSVTDSDKFTDLPLFSRNGLIGTRYQYFHVDYKDKVFTPKYQLQKGEFTMTGTIQRKDAVLVVTSKQTLIFKSDAFSNKSSWVEPGYSIPNPTSAAGISNIYTYRIAEGYLLLYFGKNHLGFDIPGAEVLLAKTDGEVETLGKHAFTQHDKAMWRRYSDHAISPIANYIYWATYSALDAHPIAPSMMKYYQQRQYPSSVLVFVLVTHILSAIIVFLLSRHHKLPVSLSFIWLFTSLCFGISGLMSFVFLNSWQITRTIFTGNKNRQPAQQLTATH